jgi:N-acetyl-anhydromuramyl-L-alanine amidase AmpD
MSRKRKVVRLLAVLLGAVVAGGATHAAAARPNGLQAAFAQASREFGVPQSVLLAVSYNETRWEQHAGRPSTWGGYGLMHLTDVGASRARGDGVARSGADARLHTLLTASRLIGASPQSLKTDAAQNVRGGAALLARYERRLVGSTPDDPAPWYGAVARYSGSSVGLVARGFADDVYATIRSGASRRTALGLVTLRAQAVRPDRATARALDLRGAQPSDAECPNGLDCRFVPAAYQQNSADPGDYGNYDLANRPADGLDIRYIVIHDTETSYDDAIAIFSNPLAYVSAHYVVRSSDGEITQMVRTKNVAWQAGNWYVNMHSVGIENEGVAVDGATWYTEQLYHATARLTRYLAERFGVPLDREHIVGHDDVPGPTAPFQAGMHWDPGPFWNWSHFMALVGAPTNPSGDDRTGRIVTIAPKWDTNRPVVTYCDPTCRTLPSQPANFVYLRTAPSEGAALIHDPGLPGSGTTRANDWGDKAVTGQTFAVAERLSDWTAIWYGGQKAWFADPNGRSEVPGGGTLVTPRVGLASIPVYGRAYPTSISTATLGYTIPAGQTYVAKDLVTGSYYEATTFNDPASYRLWTDATRFYEIRFNHRIAYLRADDVQVVP